MKSLTKSKAHKNYQQTLEKKSEIGQQMEEIRQEIKDLMDERKTLQRQQENPETSVSGLLNWKSSKKTEQQLQDKIEEKTEELQRLDAKVDDLKEQVESEREKMLKTYVAECEEVQEKLFKKLDELKAVNEELKEIEAEYWEPLSLAHAGFASPYLHQLSNIERWIEQLEQQWQRMKDRKM